MVTGPPLASASPDESPSARLGSLLNARIGTHAKQLEQAIVAAKTDALRPLGLTVPQYAALLAIDHLQPTSAAQLARSCLTTPQTMATVLANLQAKGMIERHTSELHHKLVEVALTDVGRDLLARADAVAARIEADLLDAIGPDRLRQLIEITHIVQERLPRA